MNIRNNKLAWFLLAFTLLFLGTGAVGLVGPDEPRYADVARAMLRSGDYITPRLFGTPWFEKPPLYYWSAALFFRFGVNELNARLPSVLAAAGFLGLWFWFCRRFFQWRTAALACILLGSSVGWVGFAHGAVTDMLFTATLDAALVFLAMWFWQRETHYLYSFYALLGLAVLAKGPAAIVLAGIVALGYVIATRDWKALSGILISPGIALFALVAVPWYVLCYSQNGFVFIQEFIIKHNFERYTSAALGHPQPVWFYVPVLAAGLFPWTPLLLLPLIDCVSSGWRSFVADRYRTLLFFWIALPFLFFSISKNKLPGYLLPVLPPLTLWFALIIERPESRARAVVNQTEVGLQKPRVPGADPAPTLMDEQDSTPAQRISVWLIAISAVLLLAVLMFVPMIGPAITSGARQAFSHWHLSQALQMFRGGPVRPAAILFLLAPLGFAFYFLWRRDVIQAAFLVAAGLAMIQLGIVGYLSPELDRVASVRSVAQRMQRMGIIGPQVAVYQINRTQSLGLSYYLDHELPQWDPQSGAESIEYVVASDDAVVPDAHGVSLFPGQHLRLWALPPTHFEIEIVPRDGARSDTRP